MLDEVLLQILACPQDKGPLYYFPDECFLYNPRLRRRYEIRQGIPIMLIDEAVGVDSTEHDRLMAQVAEQNLELTFEPAETFKPFETPRSLPPICEFPLPPSPETFEPADNFEPVEEKS